MLPRLCSILVRIARLIYWLHIWMELWANFLYSYRYGYWTPYCLMSLRNYNCNGTFCDDFSFSLFFEEFSCILWLFPPPPYTWIQFCYYIMILLIWNEMLHAFQWKFLLEHFEYYSFKLCFKIVVCISYWSST